MLPFLRRPRARAEFWIVSASDAAVSKDDLKRGVGSLPGDLFGDEGVDPWTFSDVRFRLGDAEGAARREAMGAILRAGSLAEEASHGERVTKLVFAGEVRAEGFPLATVTAATLAAARLLEATTVFDAVSGRAWAPADLAATCRREGIVSAAVHLREESWSENGLRGIAFSGFEKRGSTDFRSHPFPADLSLITGAAFRAYAAARWTGAAREFSFEAHGDRYLFRERRGLVRLYRMQEAR